MAVLNAIACMYVTLAPVIVAGIVNMVVCKLKILSALQVPMDGGRCLKDGNRIFGDHKTWKGFLSYILLGAVFTALWGGIIRDTSLNAYDHFYAEHENTFKYNILVGLLLGSAYALFELPNSFFKRRLGIAPGKGVAGAWKWAFLFLDQADSIFGCALVVWMFYKLGILRYIGFVLLGALTHILLNMLLYFAHLRKNMF